jgi:hypothetical protein
MTQLFTMQSKANGEFRRGCAWLDLLRGAVGFLLVFFGVATGAQQAAAQDQAPMDYQVKAAFIVNFPKYVDWPDSVFATTNSPITVAVIGDDNVADEFANMIAKGKSVGGHPIVLKRITDEKDIAANCQIVFVGVSERERNSVILKKAQASGILTVGESDDFLEKGGVINLVHQGRKIHLQVNLAAAQEQHLKISSRLLMVSDVVKGTPH